MGGLRLSDFATHNRRHAVLAEDLARPKPTQSAIFAIPWSSLISNLFHDKRWYFWAVCSQGHQVWPVACLVGLPCRWVRWWGICALFTPSLGPNPPGERLRCSSLVACTAFDGHPCLLLAGVPESDEELQRQASLSFTMSLRKLRLRWWMELPRFTRQFFSHLVKCKSQSFLHWKLEAKDAPTELEVPIPTQAMHLAMMADKAEGLAWTSSAYSKAEDERPYKALCSAGEALWSQYRQGWKNLAGEISGFPLQLLG